MNELVPELLIGAVRLAEEEVPFLRKEKEFKVVVFFCFSIILTANFRICHTGL